MDRNPVPLACGNGIGIREVCREAIVRRWIASIPGAAGCVHPRELKSLPDSRYGDRGDLRGPGRLGCSHRIKRWSLPVSFIRSETDDEARCDGLRDLVARERRVAVEALPLDRPYRRARCNDEIIEGRRIGGLVSDSTCPGENAAAVGYGRVVERGGYGRRWRYWIRSTRFTRSAAHRQHGGEE